MCWLCCWIFFWNTQYNTPRSFCLADYSDVFCDLCPASKQSTNHSNCIQALSCDTSDKYATLSHTNSQVGFVRKSAPPVTFHAPWFPCGPVDAHSFPNTCFIVTTTGLISDWILTDLSRLVYMNHYWRTYVGIPPLAVSPQLFFVDSKPPTGC